MVTTVRDLQRFMGKVWPLDELNLSHEDLGDCWLWTGALSNHGYGIFQMRKQTVGAHQWFYELVNGPVTRGLQLDHLCRNRDCVNPDHLEPVRGRQNVLRGVGISSRNNRKTYCPQGHEYTPENTRVTAFRGRPRRECRTCRRERNREYANRVWHEHAEPKSHGRTGYKNHGCRCNVCQEAMSEYMRAYYQRKKASA